MSGPDLTFSITFAPANAAELTQAVRLFNFEHFARHVMTAQFCRQHGKHCSYDMYIDMRNYHQMIENIEGRGSSNLWVYHAIEVCQASLLIERGYGGYGNPYAAEERALLYWLISLPQLELQTWKALAGGDGYTHVELASGSASAELVAYID